MKPESCLAALSIVFMFMAVTLYVAYEPIGDVAMRAQIQTYLTLFFCASLATFMVGWFVVVLKRRL